MMPIVNSASTKKVQVQNVVKAAPAIWARVFHTAVQSIPDSTEVAINFNSERWDTDTIHDPSTNNTRLTCRTAGVYRIKAQLGYAANSTGRRECNIRLNGTTIIGADNRDAVTGVVTRLDCGTTWFLAVNEYVEMIAYQTSGGALNTEQAGNFSPEFMMERVGA